MSVEQEVAELILAADSGDDTVASAAVTLAVEEVRALFTGTNDTFHGTCMKIEAATSKQGLLMAFRRFDRIMRIFLEVFSGQEHDQLIRQAVSSLEGSPCFRGFLGSSTCLQEAVTDYKTTVVRDLANSLQTRRQQADVDEEANSKLFSQFIPVVESPAEVISGVVSSTTGTGVKRGLSAVVPQEFSASIPKKRSNVPALDAVHRLSGLTDDARAVKKNVLRTREKLRAGLHDPKGLLDLIGSSTNALERTKKLELLKSSGLLNKTQGARSFSVKLNRAKERLDLGLGGQSVNDSLTFGAKVLSSPGFLSAKNISDVENGVVEGNTTWKHQDAYCKMIIAGCLNQAKRILLKYDEVLYGASPEVLVEATHTKIRKLLQSDESRKFLGEVGHLDEETTLAGDNFIKQIIEAVAPIIPITLRNKSLDGTYLRMALHMLGAGELLFAQYQQDVREHSNPAGVVGLAAAMHSEFESTAIYSNKLRSLDDFMKDMRSQYQTSLGLGTPFAKDSFPGTRRRRGGRGRSYWRNRRFYTQGVNRMQEQQSLGTEGFQGIGQPADPSGAVMGQRGGYPHRGRGICYAYGSGNCHRGASCKFLHLNQ